MNTRILSTFPSSDHAFQRVVERIAADTGTSSKEDLARRLRPLFPRVAVFEGQLAGEPSRLYVFRDGRYELTTPDRWWEGDAVACIRLSIQSGRIVNVSREYAELIRADRDDLVGRHYTDFVQPEAREAAQTMFSALAENREVSTEALLRRVDGTTLRIELHASRLDGEINVYYRPIDDRPPGARPD